MVVLGPKELPRYLRKAGQWASRLRRLATEMREKSGIDEILRTEGLDREIAEFRRLARGEILGVTSAVRAVANATRIDPPLLARPHVPPPPPDPSYVEVPAPIDPVRDATREREYPREGADSYGAMSDMAAMYEELLVPTPLADDGLYTRGETPPEGAAAPAMSTPPPAESSTAPTTA